MCNLFSKVTTQACTVLPHFVLIVELKDKQRLAPLKKNKNSQRTLNVAMQKHENRFRTTTERCHAETRIIVQNICILNVRVGYAQLAI